LPIPTGSIVQLHVDEMDGERDDEVEGVWTPILRRLQAVLVDGQQSHRSTAA